MLALDVDGSLAVIGRDDTTAPVRISMDSGSGVTAISEALAYRIQRMVPDDADIINPFDGRARIVTALGADRDIVTQSLPTECTSRLHELVLGVHGDGFRRELAGDPPADVKKPLVVQRKPGASPSCTKPIVFSPHKAVSLAEHMEN